MIIGTPTGFPGSARSHHSDARTPLQRPPVHDRDRGGIDAPRRRQPRPRERDRGVLAAVPDELEGQVKPELLQSVLEVATTPCEDVRSAGEQLRVLRRSVAEIAERRGLLVAASGTHPFALLGGPADRRSAPLPGAGRRARLHRPPGADLRHPRPRRDRGPRQGDLRRGRDPALPAAAARPVVELALLARRADRVDVLADAGLPGLSQGRDPAPLRHLGDLLPPGRADDARRRDRGLHLPVVGRATAPEAGHGRDADLRPADEPRPHGGPGRPDHRARPPDEQALRRGAAAGRVT